jgi:L-malate glycosyltransferase
LRILHLSTARTWRGGEQQLAYLLEALRKLGQEQEVFCPKGSPLEAFCKEKGFPCATFVKRVSTDPVTGWEIKRMCRKRGIDLIHAHDSHAHTAAYLGALFGNKTPIVVSRRVDFPIGKGGFSLKKYHHPAVRKILCVSEEIRRILLLRYRRPERAAVVYSGIDLEKFQAPATGILRRQYGIAPETPIVANVAAIAPHKGYFTFVDVAARIPEAVFLIIGADGGEQDKVEEYIRTSGLQERVILTGFRKDIPAILPEADVFLFPSETEGLGTSLIDALACGVPAVTTRTGGIPEVVEDGVSGLLAPVGDADALAAHVREILGDKALRERLSAAGRERARHFSKENTAFETLAHYREAAP